MKDAYPGEPETNDTRASALAGGRTFIRKISRTLFLLVPSPALTALTSPMEATRTSNRDYRERGQAARFTSASHTVTKISKLQRDPETCSWKLAEYICPSIITNPLRIQRPFIPPMPSPSHAHIPPAISPSRKWKEKEAHWWIERRNRKPSHPTRHPSRVYMPKAQVKNLSPPRKPSSVVTAFPVPHCMPPRNPNHMNAPALPPPPPPRPAPIPPSS